MKRMLFLSRLKPEGYAEYIRLHQKVWAEIEDGYRKAGITEVVCWLNGLDLIVYSEYDESKYPASQVELDASQVEQRWQKLMAGLVDQTYPRREFLEIYRMSQSKK